MMVDSDDHVLYLIATVLLKSADTVQLIIWISVSSSCIRVIGEV